ncbi:MAG: hypothetical protein M3O20_01785 [Acidobacteriota bacterium]|nr:hypothetical protein [Acidobacteriota bacterium]
MKYVYDFLGIGNGIMLLSVLILILCGSFRKFWILFLYVAWELLATATLTLYDVLYAGPAQGKIASVEAVKLYNRLYWSNDVIVDLLRFLLVIVFTYAATPEGAKRISIRRILCGIVAVVLVLPFLLFPLHFAPWPRAAWFNSTSELLNFGAAIMNLALWGALLANRKRDPQLVAVSIGLGIVVTGAAISYGLRHLTSDQAVLPNLFLMLTQLVGWSIWCRAFWRSPRTSHAPENVLPSPSPAP